MHETEMKHETKNIGFMFQDSFTGFTTSKVIAILLFSMRKAPDSTIPPICQELELLIVEPRPGTERE